MQKKQLEKNNDYAGCLGALFGSGVVVTITSFLAFQKRKNLKPN